MVTEVVSRNVDEITGIDLPEISEIILLRGLGDMLVCFSLVDDSSRRVVILDMFEVDEPFLSLTLVYYFNNLLFS